LSSTKVEPSFAIALSYQQHHMNKNLHLPVENFVHGDPKGIQFEPLLAHFEQLRQMYEMMEKEENDV